MSADLYNLTIAEASTLIARRMVSPVDLVRTFLDRIENHNARFSGFVLVRGEEALEEAKQAENDIMKGRSQGPLHGIPVGLKDVIDTAGVRTTCGSRLRKNHVPVHNATAWRRLSEAGAILLGKHETTEFAFGAPDLNSLHPPARNAWNPDHFGGGSSGGSCVSVAAGLCMGALGSDAGGSIRTPAGLNGVTGLKPTYGRVSRHGVFPVSFTADHCGPIAWTAEDCAVLLGVIAGHDPADPTSAKAPVPDYQMGLSERLDGLRVGYIRHFSCRDTNVSDSVNNAVETAINTIADLGAEVEEVELPHLWDFTACNSTILIAEAFTIHGWNLKENPESYTSTTRDRLMLGAAIRASDYIEAQRLRHELIDRYAEVTAEVDVLVCAGLLAPAPLMSIAAEVQKFYLIENPVLTTPFNVTGAPAVAVCCGFDGTGLPVSMQIAGGWFEEGKVLRVAHAYQQATEWSKRRPVP